LYFIYFLCSFLLVIYLFLRERVCDQPLVEMPAGAIAVRPGLYCEVSFVDQTRAGVLRAPVFERLIEEA
jgi:hypothetical protein